MPKHVLFVKFFIDRNFVDGLLGVWEVLKNGSGRSYIYIFLRKVKNVFYVVNFTPLILYMSTCPVDSDKSKTERGISFYKEDAKFSKQAQRPKRHINSTYTLITTP